MSVLSSNDDRGDGGDEASSISAVGMVVEEGGNAGVKGVVPLHSSSSGSSEAILGDGSGKQSHQPHILNMQMQPASQHVASALPAVPVGTTTTAAATGSVAVPLPLMTSPLVAWDRGNVPMIITIPHGGMLTPSHLPDRTSGYVGCACAPTYAWCTWNNALRSIKT